MLAGEDLEPMHLRLEPLVHVLDRLPVEQLSDLFNVTGTSTKLDLLLFLSSNNITVDVDVDIPSLRQQSKNGTWKMSSGASPVPRPELAYRVLTSSRCSTSALASLSPHDARPSLRDEDSRAQGLQGSRVPTPSSD
ncbi:hypothetical protein RRG08_055400 [Elysia crispata]|uniref:Uncharacterized protein n=1 Tax=Elysia crispata TaxID=231223 RepID=A0AAE1E311_9GAST|nr:hypothetical protein RRG08_055400 [Elysia crispata]